MLVGKDQMCYPQCQGPNSFKADRLVSCGDEDLYIEYFMKKEKVATDVRIETTELVPSFAGFFFQAEDGIRDYKVTGVQTCALPISIPETDGRFRGRLELVRPVASGALTARRLRAAAIDPVR